MVDGGLHRFEPDAAAVRGGEGGAVAQRGHRRVVCQQPAIDDDAVRDGKAGGLGELGVGTDASSEDDEVAGDALAGGEQHCAGLDGLGPGAEQNPGAHALVKEEEVRRDLRRDHAGHQPVRGLQHGHVDAGGAGDGGELQADEAAADHHGGASGGDPLAQASGVGQGPEANDAGVREPDDRRAGVSGACREDQVVVG